MTRCSGAEAVTAHPYKQELLESFIKELPHLEEVAALDFMKSAGNLMYIKI